MFQFHLWNENFIGEILNQFITCELGISYEKMFRFHMRNEDFICENIPIPYVFTCEITCKTLVWEEHSPWLLFAGECFKTSWKLFWLNCIHQEEQSYGSLVPCWSGLTEVPITPLATFLPITILNYVLFELRVTSSELRVTCSELRVDLLVLSSTQTKISLFIFSLKVQLHHQNLVNRTTKNFSWKM